MRTKVSKASRTNNATQDLRTAQEVAISVDRTTAINSSRTAITIDMTTAMTAVMTTAHSLVNKIIARDHHEGAMAIAQCAPHHRQEAATEDVMIIHHNVAATTTMAQTTAVLVPDLQSMIVASQIVIANVVLLRLAVQSMMPLCLSLLVLLKKFQTSKFW